jgi:hypothetical protein
LRLRTAFATTLLTIVWITLSAFWARPVGRAAGQAPAPAGLVLALGFDEITGTAVTDASGLGNNGTINGATRTAAGRYGAALSFDGINDWVTVADAASLDLTTRLTVEAWVFPTALNSWETVVLKEAPAALVYGLYGDNDNGRPAARVRISGDSTSAMGRDDLPLNAWTHLAMTYDGAAVRLFVNGTQVRSAERTGSMANSAGALRIGGNAVSSQFFNGRIDEVRIYNRALTASEIQADMAVPVAPPDSVPPSASVTAPVDGASVSSVVTVTASASDNQSVAGVRLLVDGQPHGLEDTAAPFQFAWDTRLITNGTHVLTVSARDGAGNVAESAPVSTTVVNIPRLLISAPANNATVTGTALNIAYSVAGDPTGLNVDHVHFQVDGGSEIMDRTLDGQFSIQNLTSGAHTLSGFLVRADHSKISGTDAAPVAFTVVLPDVTNPSVLLTSPASGATVSGTVLLQADASDNVGVAGVQFLRDGINIGAEDTVAPYAVSWNTTTLVNGTYGLTARARDAVGNVATHSVDVSVTNTTGAAATGQWSPPFELGIVALHLALMKNGKMLMWDGPSSGGVNARIWDPISGSLVTAPNTHTNLFCAGHVALSDGTILTLGGDDSSSGTLGTRDVNAFDPATSNWTSRAPMTRLRWYPTGTVLADGRVVVMSGASTCYTCHVIEQEIYDPRTNSWTTLPGSADYHIPLYPLNFLLSDGTILNAGSYEGTMPTRSLNLETSTWTTIDPQPIDAQTAVMYGPDRFMKAGKWANSDPPFVASHGRTYVLDMTQPGALWRETSPMNKARAYHVLTLLPDGSTLATGGGGNTDPNDNAAAVREAEIWDPTTESWSLMASAQIPRLYHGSAMLLPDGRVLVAGSGVFTETNQTRGEIFSPPYLFKGPRPVVSFVPETLKRGEPFVIETPDPGAIASVSLIRVGTMTHSFNPDQRFLRLDFTQAVNGVSAALPANPNMTPPGYYLLFAISDRGVPSVGKFVRVPATTEDSAAPTAPHSLAGSGGPGTVALTWGAATDDVGVALYNVHRSATPGFLPAAGNRVAQVTGTSYGESVPAGTYYYQVTAQDAAQNVGPPSNEAAATVTADTTAPTVAVTSPSSGSTVAGTVPLTASASDDVAVMGVQFLIDGIATGAEDTSAPYSINWTSTLAANGNHVITARARDAAGNTTAADVSVTVTNTALPAGLVLALGFDEAAGTAVTDTSGHENHGTVSGATRTTAGRYGAALSFDGINDWVTVADAASLDLTNRLTVEAWVFPTALNSWETVVLKEAPAELVYALYADNDARRPGAWVRVSGVSTSAVGPAVLPLNAWSHLAMTYDGAQVSLFVDGTLVRTVARTGSMSNSTNPLRIGGNAVWTEFFNGRIDEVRIYNRALTAGEIQADMVTPIVR